jgi:hypothetical protein
MSSVPEVAVDLAATPGRILGYRIQEIRSIRQCQHFAVRLIRVRM